MTEQQQYKCLACGRVFDKSRAGVDLDRGRLLCDDYFCQGTAVPIKASESVDISK